MLRIIFILSFFLISCKSIENKNPSKANKMAFIPAGEFIMGSNERWDDEAPEHISSTQAFYIDLN